MESPERLNGSGIGFKRQEEVESWIPRKVQPISSESLELVIKEQQSNQKKGQQWPICITMWPQMSLRMAGILQVMVEVGMEEEVLPATRIRGQEGEEAVETTQ